MIGRPLPDPYQESLDQRRFVGLILAELYLNQGIDRLKLTREAIEDDIWTLVELKQSRSDDDDAWVYSWKVRGHPAPHRPYPCFLGKESMECLGCSTRASCIEKNPPAAKPSSSLTDERDRYMEPGKAEYFLPGHIRAVDIGIGMCLGAMLILLGIGIASWLS